MSYTVTTNGTTRNLNDIFDARSSTGTSTTNLTNYTYTISGQVVDLYNYYNLLGTNWNLKFPSSTNYKTLVNGTTTDLADIFQLDFIQSAPSGVTYTPTTSGVLIKMTANGRFTFKYPLSSIEVLGVGGGGGGGQQANDNAGGGGGGGEVYYFKYNYSSGFTIIDALIGNGGTGGISSSGTNASSGSTTSVYLNNFDTSVNFRGGGAGGGGKGDGANGGSGGGAGSYSSGVPSPGSSVKSNTGGYGNSGGYGQDQNNNSGSGGGGGGAGSAGTNGGDSSTASYGGSGVTITIGGKSITLGAGGGGGGRNYTYTTGYVPKGGSDIGGNGSYITNSGGFVFAKSGTANTGSGGGGCCNEFNSSSSNVGGNGGSGVVYLYVDNSYIKSV